ncbi:MAG: NADPH-dependent F420 reductase [Rhodospirillaceae bacterium]|jgi:NADPH-dependent F420 reductase
MNESFPVIGVLGGTGHEGYGLALRWAKAGYKVIIGSRDETKAWTAANQINTVLSPPKPAVGASNKTAATDCGIAVLAVPSQAQIKVADEVQNELIGKILIDVTVPLVPPKVLRVQLPESGSAVAALQSFLGDQIHVVSAFQNIAANHLADLSKEIDCDVLVCGNKKSAREEVIKLANAAGMRAWHAGPIENSAAAEAMTSILLFINRNYEIDGSGLRITGDKTL